MCITHLYMKVKSDPDQTVRVPVSKTVQQNQVKRALHAALELEHDIWYLGNWQWMPQSQFEK